MGITDKWQRDRFKFGICDVQENYNFFFKWLVSKIEQVIVLKNVPETIDITYLKEHLLLDGDICITDFNGKLYACIGSHGGEPNEYYKPTQFIIANPILGSKIVNVFGDNKDGVVIYNTPTDRSNWFNGGLFQLVKQTATLLADNIVSINCAQINTRVEAVYTAESEAQAAAGEVTLKKLYAGQPFQVLRSDVVEKIGVNPVATAATSNKLKELVELHQYIIAQFFQAIGIKANAINKKERMITDEINSQDDYLGISLLDMIESWKKGFDEVNELYGTDIQVEINPILIERIISGFEEETQEQETEKPAETVEQEETTEEEVIETTDTDTTETDTTDTETTDDTTEPAREVSDTEEKIEEQIETTEVIIEQASDTVASDTVEDGGESDV